MLQREKRSRLKPLLRERLHEFGLSWRAKRSLEWTEAVWFNIESWPDTSANTFFSPNHDQIAFQAKMDSASIQTLTKKPMRNVLSREGGIQAGNLTEHHTDNPPQGGAQVENNETLPSRPGQRLTRVQWSHWLTVSLFKCYMTSHLIWWVRPQERLQPRPKGCTVAQIMILGNCPKACWV